MRHYYIMARCGGNFMRIAALQQNYIIGDFAYNKAKILAGYQEAVAAGAELVITPELALLGYPPKDLLFQPAFLSDLDAALNDLTAQIGSVPLILGTVRRHPESLLAYNCAIVIQNGQISAEVAKQLLPNNDVFDERRYFAPGEPSTVVTLAGHKVGLTICEDFWNDRDFWRLPRYDYDPIPPLVKQGATLLINIAASPYYLGKVAFREELFAKEAAKWQLPVVYVNQIGGQDGLIFDGHSMYINSSGDIIAKGAGFKEDLIIGELDIPQNSAHINHELTLERHRPDAAILPRGPEWEKEVADALSLGISDYVKKCHFKNVLIGLSGGIDSALVATLAVRALGTERVHGITMPSRYSPDDSAGDAYKLAENLGITIDTIPIEPIFAAALSSLTPIFGPTPWGVTQENLQARIRGTLLMAYSNKNGHLLLTTGNKSEIAVGYATLYGDMCGGLAVIGDLFKTDVYKVAAFLNKEAGRELIPASTLTKAPSAELAPGQKDEDSLPPYALLDAILRRYLEGNEHIDNLFNDYPPETVQKVLGLIKRNEYKRAQAAPILKVSGLSFGAGRRYPIAQNFSHGL